MLDSVQQWDAQLLLAVNQYQGTADGFFLFLSNKYNWLPLYIFLLLYFLWQRGWKKALIFLGLTLVVVGLCDFLSVQAFKNVFERLRPCHNPDLLGQVQTIAGKCGGQFGFVSSHAANHFGLATWFVFVFGKHFNWYKCPFWVWAVLIGLSRVYLGVHYPGDVLVGALLGILIATLGWRLFHHKLGWI